MTNEETNKLLKGILMALVLKEKERGKQVKILKEAGLNKTQILEVLGPSSTTLRTRKYRAKKK